MQFRRDGPASGAPAFMSFDTFTRLIDQFPQLEHLHLQGLGEPMMHPRFFYMVVYAAANGVLLILVIVRDAGTGRANGIRAGKPAVKADR